MEIPEKKIEIELAQKILLDHFDLQGELSPLPGEIDFNFLVTIKGRPTYILKISRTDQDGSGIDFQVKILTYLADRDPAFSAPKIIPDKKGQPCCRILGAEGEKRMVRLLTWIPGRLWSSVNPVLGELRFDLGRSLGSITDALRSFSHPAAHRKLDWDIANGSWTKKYLDLFTIEQRRVLNHFLQLFEKQKQGYSELRKAVVHNDSNDNNIIVSEDLINPKIKAVIDFGDSVYTQIINDLAIACAYAIMDCPDPLEAALPVVEGYNSSFPLEEKELAYLYTSIGMRLVISVTKSAINKTKEPENVYLQISDRPAWELLEKWISINPEFAHYSFRNACGFDGNPQEKAFHEFARNNTCALETLFPASHKKTVYPLDLRVSSKWLGHEQEFNDPDFFQYKINALQKEYSQKFLAGGYLEPRPIYNTAAYEKTGNQGTEHRTIHLGVDFWLPASTPVHVLFDGEIVTAVYDKLDKGYGGLIIVKHSAGNLHFFTLYGHLSKESVSGKKPGQILKKGDFLATLGNYQENGHWVPHLHFQLMLSLLGHKNDFPGVAFHKQTEVWKSICPDPNLLFKLGGLAQKKDDGKKEILKERKNLLGKSLSLQYSEPLHIVRGAGAYLMDYFGRKYLDTVNNVAHVGHEHFRVVKAGQEQMALLNTNTRYLHENINLLARELLSTLPKELCVVHFVNSGSEANELALRMAKAATGEKDFIASQVGYHGNTNACVDVSSYKFEGKGGKGKPEHTHIFPLPDAFRGKYRGSGSGKLYADEVQKCIDAIHEKGRGLAGMIIESIISCGGQIELPKGFLKSAFSYVRKAGGICISDEVQTGCGRVGKGFWGFELHHVIPDIVTIGKPLGNGHPLAAVVCTREIADKFANGMEYFNTFGGNPVSCAIGRSVLQVVKEEGLQEQAFLNGFYLKSALGRLANEFPVVGDVRGEGLFLGFELVSTDLKPLERQASYLVNRMKELGVLMSTDGPDNNVIKIKPPMVFNRENAMELVTSLRRVLQEDFMKMGY